MMVGGGSHTIRLWKPYPFFAAGAEGPCVRDIDGNVFVDYWQGHYANILGHNPPEILKEIVRFIKKGALHTGFEARHQVELAELLLSRLGAGNGKVRFTTSGTLATMYSVMLSQSRTGRELVLKIGGGWHGSSPYLLKGVHYTPEEGFDAVGSSGVLRDAFRKTIVTRFNDGDALERIFEKRGDKIACFIVEPFLGVGGFLPASREYLALARNLTRKYGAILIFDEIISGFRFCPSGVQTLYGIRPDLTTFGKVMGGGHAVAAVFGRADILDGCERSGRAGKRVLFEGGTFSAHSEYMKAGLTMLRLLVKRADTVYPQLARAGDTIRKRIEDAFMKEGVRVQCTGGGNDVVSGSSLFMVHFPRIEGRLVAPEDLNDARMSDTVLREDILKLALLVNGINIVHGGGAVSAAHTKSDIDRTIEGYRAAARLFRQYLF